MMKSSAVINLDLLIVLVICLSGCKINIVPAPVEVELKRSDLPTYTFGSYISGVDDNNKTFAGELIGVRNDTLVVLSQTLYLIATSSISNARVVIFKPNNYSAGYLLLVPNVVMIFAGGSYGGPAFILGLLMSATDIGGVLSAKSWENSNFNYVDWGENPSKLLHYSRFPAGIPSEIELYALRPKSIF